MQAAGGSIADKDLADYPGPRVRALEKRLLVRRRPQCGSLRLHTARPCCLTRLSGRTQAGRSGLLSLQGRHRARQVEWLEWVADPSPSALEGHDLGATIFGDRLLHHGCRPNRQGPTTASADDLSPGVSGIGPTLAPRRSIESPAPVAALDQTDRRA